MSCAATSALEAPSLTRVAIRRSCGVKSSESSRRSAVAPLAGGCKLTLRTVRKRERAHAFEQQAGCAELLASIPTSSLAAQPFSVNEPGACKLRPRARALEAIDRLSVEPFGFAPAEKERLRPRQHAEPPIGAARGSTLGEHADGLRRELFLAASHCRLDQVGKRSGHEDLIEAGVLRGDHGLVIAAETELENAQRRLGKTDEGAEAARSSVPRTHLGQRPRPSVLPTPRSQNERAYAGLSK